MGLFRTIQVIAEFPERETTLPLMGDALREDDARATALGWLLAAPESRAAREILRAWDVLPAGSRQFARNRGRVRLLASARQLLRADRTLTRRNVAEFLAEEGAPPGSDVEALLPDLAQLADDPDPRTSTIARGAFLDALLHEPQILEGLLPHHPLVGTLSVLLRTWPRHEDRRVIEALLQVGPGGDAWLERAVGEEWPSVEAIVEVVARPRSSAGAVRRLGLLCRWLEGPREPARRRAREILRSTESPELLRAATLALEDPRREGELPTWRRLRYWTLSDEDLAALPERTLGRIADFLAGGDGDPTERAERVARLLPLASGATLRSMLERLRGLPIDTVLPALTPILSSDDAAARILVLELLPSEGATSLPLIVSQLGAPDESVRAAAARRIAGKGLRLWSEGRDRIPPPQRRATLSALGKVDVTFMAQLRRALGSREIDTAIAALRTVAELENPAPLEDALVDLVVHPDPRLRATVTRTLARTGRATGLHYLKLLLDDDDGRVVANAVEELAAIGDRSVIPLLLHAATHEDPRVRTNALLALARGGDAGARKTLSELAGGAGPQRTRTSACWALDVLEQGGKR